MSNVKNLEAALSILGKGGATLASEKKVVSSIPTDFDELNSQVLGVGGIPRGKVIELYSKPSVGKSTFCYWLIGQVQKRGGIAAIIDGEGSFYTPYAEACGIDCNSLINVEFTWGEDALYKAKQLIASDLIDLLVIDSIPTLQPLAAGEAVNDKVSMNISLARAKMYTEFWYSIQGGYTIAGPDGKDILSEKEYVVGRTKVKNLHRIHDKKVCILAINHAKTAIGVMGFGERTKTPGGEALEFASAIRLDLKYIGKSKKKAPDGQPLFREVKIRAVKNKVALPYNEIVVRLMRGGGVTLKDQQVSEEVEQVEEGVEIPDLPQEEDILSALKSLAPR